MASLQQYVYPGVPGHAPGPEVAEASSRAVGQAMALIRSLTPTRGRTSTRPTSSNPIGRAASGGTTTRGCCVSSSVTTRPTCSARTTVSGARPSAGGRRNTPRRRPGRLDSLESTTGQGRVQREPCPGGSRERRAEDPACKSPRDTRAHRSSTSMPRWGTRTRRSFASGSAWRRPFRGSPRRVEHFESLRRMDGAGCRRASDRCQRILGTVPRVRTARPAHTAAGVIRPGLGSGGHGRCGPGGTDYGHARSVRSRPTMR